MEGGGGKRMGSDFPFKNPAWLSTQFMAGWLARIDIEEIDGYCLDIFM